MLFTNCKLLNVGDRFKVVGKVKSNIDHAYEGKSATVVEILDPTKKTYHILFDDGIRCKEWTDGNDMEYLRAYPLHIGFCIRNKKDKSEWIVDKITAYYEFWGHCVKAGSEYRIDEKGGSSSLDDYEIISNNKNMFMKKLSTMMKRLLDKDTQVLVKAGFINGDLEITTEGQSALNSIVFIERKAELVKLAEEVLAEAEKDK